MPPADSSALIVARFLKSNRYTQSYAAFINEAGLPESAGDVSKGDLTLETLLEEKKTFDLSVKFEKLGTSDGTTSWGVPAPRHNNLVTSLPSSSNLLSVTVEAIDDSTESKSMLLASTADRRLQVLNAPALTLQTSLSSLQDSPVLSCAVIYRRIVVSASMSGQVIASDISGTILDKRRDHAKYVVKVVTTKTQEGTIMIATAGWDNKICLYSPTVATSGPFKFGDPISTITLPSKPESLLFIQHPDTSEPILVITRTDSSFLFYYTATSQPELLGKQNLAPHSNAWVAFTPSSLALCPTDPTLIAVGTSTVPHMKLLVVRLLIPSHASASNLSALPQTATTLRRSLLDDTPVSETQASQARAALAVADREHSAIQIHCTTMAPQTAYSTPAVAWRPNGSGVWVNGDDGAIRGIEAKTGKVVCTLQGGHEEGSKVRCLWAGNVPVGADSGDEEEWLVSGGFDQRLVVWTTQ